MILLSIHIGKHGCMFLRRGGLIVELRGFHSCMDSHITLRHHSRVTIGCMLFKPSSVRI